MRFTRTGVNLDRLKLAVYTYIKNNPGCTVLDLNSALGYNTGLQVTYQHFQQIVLELDIQQLITSVKSSRKGKPRIFHINNEKMNMNVVDIIMKDNSEYREQILREAIETTRNLVSEGALTGFSDPEWQERLFFNQRVLTAALEGKKS